MIYPREADTIAEDYFVDRQYIPSNYTEALKCYHKSLTENRKQIEAMRELYLALATDELKEADRLICAIEALIDRNNRTIQNESTQNKE